MIKRSITKTITLAPLNSNCQSFGIMLIFSIMRCRIINRQYSLVVKVFFRSKFLKTIGIRPILKKNSIFLVI
jgi:hypothetical protein